MIEVIKSLIAANFENLFKQRIQDYINDKKTIR